MRIVVTGCQGQVVRALVERGAATAHDIVSVGRPALDLSSDRGIREALLAAEPEVIVSAAAYTAVDKAESERDLAFRINAGGTEAVARAAREIGVPLIHLSTDYVFDGLSSTPYQESDPTAPRSVYGASKLAGERLALSAQPDAAILRTAWVFSPFGANFIKTMLGLAIDRDVIRVVDDQRGNPTSAFDIADAIIAVANNLLARDDPQLRGVFHLASSGDASWAEVAEETFALSAALGGPTARVERIATAEYPTAAPRPLNSRLDCTLLHARHNVRLGDWREAAESVITRLVTSHPVSWSTSRR